MGRKGGGRVHPEVGNAPISGECRKRGVQPKKWGNVPKKNREGGNAPQNEGWGGMGRILHGEEPEERGMSSKKGGMCPKLERGDPKKGEFTPKRANISQIGGGGG